MAARLDKSRSYASVFGSAGAVFEQDGKLFDASGNQVVIEVISIEAPDSAPAAPKKERAKKVAPDSAPAAPSSIDEQLAAQVNAQ